MLQKLNLIWISAILLFAVGCSLLEGPQRPTIPTPMPTAPAFDFEAASAAAASAATGEPVFDPVSDIVPAVDPAIAGLQEQVSQQQLTGYVQTLEGFGTRNAFSATDAPNLGIGAARLWIFNELLRVGNGRLQVNFDDFVMNYNGVNSPQQNVVATLPGTDPNGGTIIVLAHYDTRRNDIFDGTSRSPGADDNASGVAMMLESARVLAAHEWNQTIIFVAMAAEEEGSFGAHHFVQETFLDGLNILAAINYDTVGGRVGIPQSIRLFAPDLTVSTHGQLARYYDFVAELYQPTFPVTIIDAADREGRFGDQKEFVAANIPALRLTESVEDPALINSPNDTWNGIDYSYLQSVTQHNISVVASMAGSPTRPQPPVLTPMAEIGSYLMTWNVDPRAAGYVLSFRPIASPDYAPFRFVNAQEAGNVAITDLASDTIYAVSIAALTENGRVGLFSEEFLLEQ